MSGVGDYGVNTKDIPTPELVKKVMEDFEVDEEKARKIIDFAVVMAMEKMKKWIFNTRKRQKEKADYIYGLTKKLKKGDKKVIDEIEKKILELCVS